MLQPPISIKSASMIFGAFFCLLLSCCGEEKSTASTEDWNNQTETAPSSSQMVSTEEPDQPDSSAITESEPSGNVRFLAYNLRNYLTMIRYIDGKANRRGKPEEEISAVLKVIVNGKPDILGLCEIGSKKDLSDLQQRLAKLGLDLPHAHLVQGADTVRSLAILSKYPIVATAKPKVDSYTLSGNPFQISRGVLDASIHLPNKTVRFIGAHLKSKRPIKEADEEMMRRNEAAIVRKHIDTILTDDPKAMLMVYGDLNDTKRTKSVYTIKGRANSRKRLEMIELADSRGELWTHHWKREDIYSRIDFCMSSLALTPFIDQENSKILDPADWETGSDHRALLVIIK
ncbi:endonuclease/exonuclease/phosphatase family protein [Verrucomicrobiaceae bacterium 5K15]|uniref:Endonuclease/exonuclease/phosphatase family protein n=1 Tax=Oceaniferula flava TaxID=2800421 RepID=A0AAE2S9M9_9BACT|nr:endonuclease/exonuclease/phosphatase family protein [Oceaniferula flavus]MBK1853861.1 endonuclease/exonuclease/phosphatase family protein [Oceaniferula flavus]MBM1135167.1 endonuclease/exonuclease/phosphatase family protein [Oceaniferula flavus]